MDEQTTPQDKVNFETQATDLSESLEMPTMGPMPAVEESLLDEKTERPDLLAMQATETENDTVLETTNENEIEPENEVEVENESQSGAGAGETALNDFVSQMIEDKGLADLAEGAKTELKEDLKEQLVTRINQMILAALPEDKLADLDKSLEDGSATEDSVNQLVAEAGIDVAKIAEDTTQAFRAAYLKEKAEA